MSSQSQISQYKDLVRSMFTTLYEEQNYDAFDEFYTADAVRYGGLQGPMEGREVVAGYVQQALSGFSNVEIDESHCLCEDDIVAYHFTLAGDNTESFMGAAATGERVEVDNAVFCRIEDGKIAEEWAQTDLLGLLTGVGLVELPF
ncbi:ester cyclase [Haloarchaeobius sp. DFWS5]|uniref:ester cyclase n=1 Tax=Haloarchaeobius sp. DFWS5 TaxID=3446114 RepID=UPI003EB6E918